MLKQSECSKLAKVKFKQEAQGRAEPQGALSHEETTVAKATPHRLLLSFEILFYSLLLMLLLLLLIADSADVTDDC